MKIHEMKTGTRLELELLDYGEKTGNKYISQLLEPPNGDSIIVSAPIYESRLIFIPINIRLGVTFFHSRYGLMGFTANVTLRENRGNLSVLELHVETPLENIQRRKHYRLDSLINVEYRLYSAQNKNEEEKPAYKKVMAKNISGSGACIIVDEEIPLKSVLDITLHLSDTLQAKAVCNVVRCTPLELDKVSKFELGLHFAEISAQNQDNIIKYIFEQQRVLLKKGISAK